MSSQRRRPLPPRTRANGNRECTVAQASVPDPPRLDRPFSQPSHITGDSPEWPRKRGLGTSLGSDRPPMKAGVPCSRSGPASGAGSAAATANGGIRNHCVPEPVPVPGTDESGGWAPSVPTTANRDRVSTQHRSPNRPWMPDTAHGRRGHAMNNSVPCPFPCPSASRDCLRGSDHHVSMPTPVPPDHWSVSPLSKPSSKRIWLVISISRIAELLPAVGSKTWKASCNEPGIGFGLVDS
jgi:hypothetical protein